ncbi:hypothetical protein [Calothrix rhizosoleniae]|uniref:hypothetical protein n=1 Tax=Calothrix rhizosoleniae TaxID=888997 RepID=UPI000B498FA3|nr:hypothetical protein [Calothrix rhizosoleniae]
MGAFFVEVVVGGDVEVGTLTVFGCVVGDAGIEVLVEGELIDGCLDGCIVGLGEVELTVESLTDEVGDWQATITLILNHANNLVITRKRR